MATSDMLDNHADYLVKHVRMGAIFVIFSGNSCVSADALAGNCEPNKACIEDSAVTDSS